MSADASFSGNASGVGRRHSTEYMVVARRYRPQSFEELVGQDQSSQALRNAVTTNRVGHAYLFTGARGVGKTSTARIFAKALNCVTGPTTHPCNACDVCQGIASGEDVDVLEIDGASNRGIDEIRQLRSNVNVRPSRARFKIYIIDEVHMLTTQAFNALLKTLEEPPEHVKFIFCTTDPEKIPITVLSRCQRFDFPPVETASILGRLKIIVETEGVTADEEALQLLARRAGGSMRDSQSLLEQLLSFCSGKITVADVHKMLGTAPIGRLAEITARILERDVAGALRELDHAIEQGVDAGQLCEQLLGYFRDMMAAVCGCPVDLMLHTTSTDFAILQAAGKRLGLETILAAVQILDHSAVRLRLSTHVRTLVEIALVRICHLEDLDQLPALIARLSDGTSPLPAPRLQKSHSPVAERVAETLPNVSQSQDDRRVVNANPAGPAGGGDSRSNDEAPPTVAKPASESAQKKTEIGATAAAVALEDAGPESAPLAEVEANLAWRQALDELGDLTASAAQLASRISVVGNRVSVEFPAVHLMQKEMCDRPDRKSRLEQAISKAMGRTVRLDFVLLADDLTPAEQAAVPIVSQRQRIRDLQRSPFVSRALELFDGEVLRLEEHREKSGTGGEGS